MPGCRLACGRHGLGLLRAGAGGLEGLTNRRAQKSCQWSVALLVPLWAPADTLDVWTIDYLLLLHPGAKPIGGGP